MAKPLDNGGGSELNLSAGDGPTGGAPPSLHSGADLGQALRAIREHQARTLDELSQLTRVRPGYLAAIEEMRLELLPSRPFTVGYIRAYAAALGCDPEAAAERFRADEPALDEPLHAPLGVHDERDPRLNAMIAGGCVIIAAIFLWNIARRAMIEDAPPPPTASQLATAKVLAAARPEPIILGPPLPAPVESTTPPDYETPGLAKAVLNEHGILTLESPPQPVNQVTDPPPLAKLPARFTPSGPVYGVKPGEPSLVTVQALRSSQLIVRGADGSAYFARQLAAGEAYRAPQVNGLTLHVTDPNAFQVFVGGQSKGVLPAVQASVSGLAGGEGASRPNPATPSTAAHP